MKPYAKSNLAGEYVMWDRPCCGNAFRVRKAGNEWEALRYSALSGNVAERHTAATLGALAAKVQQVAA